MRHAKKILIMLTALAAVLAPLGSPGTLANATARSSESVGGGNVSIWWGFPGGPSSTNDVTFPITVNSDTAQLEGTYFAQQFNFTGTAPVGYTGIQPMAPAPDGTPRMRALFSSFDGSSTSTHPNCSPGADGGGGTTCRVVFNASAGHTFNFEVKRVATDTWAGTVVDTSTGKRVSIGQWQIPGSGSLRTSQYGFVEYYAGVPSCSEMPRVNVTFGAPFTSSGAKGLAFTFGEYSNCVGQTTFAATPVAGGVNIVRGTIQPFVLRGTSGRCLDNLNGSNTTPALWDCNGGGNQAWYPTAQGTLKNYQGACLDAAGGGTSLGTPVILYRCHGHANQQWTVRSDGTVRNASGHCLAVVRRAITNAARVELGTCTAGAWTRLG